jgi:hypothetical protein
MNYRCGYIVSAHGLARVMTGAAKLNEPDLRPTKKPYRHTRSTDARARIPLHVFIPPYATRIPSGAVRIEDDRPDHREADLAAMRMAAKIEVHAVLRGVFKHFRRVHQEDLEGIRRHMANGAREVITTVVMRVVHADDPSAVSAAAQLESRIDQHPDSHPFECRHLFGHIMIAKDANNA